MNLKNKKYLLPLMIIGVMFFIMGFGVGISGFLIPALKDALDLTTMQSYLVIAGIYSAFVMFGVPSGILVNKIGYKKSMTIAFIIMAFGMYLFVPASKISSFPLFLVALFIGGVGNTVLQASVNPYVTILGSKDSAVVRISMMGIMNKIAWWLGPLFLSLFINLNSVDINDIILPFYIVTSVLILLSVFIYFAPLPEVKAEGEDEFADTKLSIKKTSIFQFPHLIMGAIAIFFYVGVEALPMVSIIDFAKITFGEVANPAEYSKYVTIGLVLGYIFGVIAVPKYISQTKILILFTLLGIVSTILLIYLPSNLVFYTLILVSFANSLMWPAIWPLAIADLGKFTKIGSSILVMGIVGGAVIPLIFGYLVDVISLSEGGSIADSYQLSYFIMIPSYLYILFFAVKGHKIRTK
jgi:glucose/galactose transporter